VWLRAFAARQTLYLESRDPQASTGWICRHGTATPFGGVVRFVPSTEPAPASWAAAFGHRDYRCFQGARLLSMIGMQMQSVAIGWQIYSITRRPIDLAWVGLAQFLPAPCLSLVTGHTADRFDRRRILLMCHLVMASLSIALLLVTRASGTHLAWIYALLVGVGVVRAFLGPSNQSILPTLVPREHFENAVVWGSSLIQAATVLGPTFGGIAYAAAGGASPVYASAGACSVGALLLVAMMRHNVSGSIAQSGDALRSLPDPHTPRATRPARRNPTRGSVLAGVRYVWRNPIVLGAISLDLFAVLLGGATALMPVYARDILHLGPWALGTLRSAPAAGAAVTGVALALWPIERRAGAKMLVCVAVFGIATIAFALSRNFALSLVTLAVAGSADMVSVFVRSALVQLATPDSMRGRVSAVNMVFIGASNELGEFESGVTAQWLGTVPSVVVGGIGTLIVVAVWAWRFPDLGRVDRLTDVLPKGDDPERPPG
jgi:MFS family permease